MKLNRQTVIGCLVALSLNWQVQADSDEHEDEHEGEPVTLIASEIALDHGITISEVGPATLRRTAKTYGRVVVPSNQISHIRARFGGLITDVMVDVGDAVKAGDLLATVEANASLKRYQIKAPIDGMVTQRHANAGEFAEDQVLLTLVDSSPLWAELRVFEGQLTDISTGQPVMISSATQSTASVIRTILPSMDEHPFVIARAQIDNAKGAWSSGMFVEGDVVVEETVIPLAIESRALQRMDNELGVFVKHGDQYEFESVSIGRTDGRISEILSGVGLGTPYVAGNSYLIKADIEKSSAEHDH